VRTLISSSEDGCVVVYRAPDQRYQVQMLPALQSPHVGYSRPEDESKRENSQQQGYSGTVEILLLRFCETTTYDRADASSSMPILRIMCSNPRNSMISRFRVAALGDANSASFLAERTSPCQTRSSHHHHVSHVAANNSNMDFQTPCLLA
jgi:hypothetical protein